jgi:hypothetical protein
MPINTETNPNCFMARGLPLRFLALQKQPVKLKTPLERFLSCFLWGLVYLYGGSRAPKEDLWVLQFRGSERRDAGQQPC